MMLSQLIAEMQITSGDRLQVRIGDEVRSGELYYLGIDPRNRDHDCSTWIGVQRLLAGWIERIIASPDGALFYLPFDFSDEFTRWLACEKSGSEITMVFGWATVEGWSFSPSDFSQQARELEDFTADHPLHAQTFYTPRLLSNLRSSRAHVVPPT